MISHIASVQTHELMQAFTVSACICLDHAASGQTHTVCDNTYCCLLHLCQMLLQAWQARMLQLHPSNPAWSSPHLQACFTFRQMCQIASPSITCDTYRQLPHVCNITNISTTHSEPHTLADAGHVPGGQLKALMLQIPYKAPR